MNHSLGIIDPNRPRPSRSLGDRTAFRERGTSTRRKRAAAFTLTEMLVAAAVIGVLALFAIPTLRWWLDGRGRGTISGLSNGRQLHLAIQTMSIDTFNGGGEGMEWTTLVSNRKETTATVAQVFDALTSNGYLTENDLKKLVTGPGMGPGYAAPNAGNSCFRFFPADDDSPSDQPLIVTANWDAGHLTSAAPYGQKGFIVFTKGGSGVVYTRPGDASSRKVFPVGRGYSNEVLK